MDRLDVLLLLQLIVDLGVLEDPGASVNDCFAAVLIRSSLVRILGWHFREIILSLFDSLGFRFNGVEICMLVLQDLDGTVNSFSHYLVYFIFQARCFYFTEQFGYLVDRGDKIHLSVFLEEHVRIFSVFHFFLFYLGK